MKLWFVHVETFHRHAIQRLRDHGIDVAYVCAVPERLGQLEAPEGCVLHSQWDALRGRLPASLEIETHARPADARLLDELAAGEATALLMIDRLNWKIPRVEDLRRVYFAYVAMWTTLLERSKPDVVVFQTVPHVGYDYVLYLLCRRAGVWTFIVERTSIPDRLIMLQDIEERPQPAPGLLDVPRRRSTSAEALPDRAADYYAVRNRIFLVRGEERFSKWDLARAAARSLASLAYQLVVRPGQMREPIRASVHGLEDRVPSRLRYQWRYFLDTVRMGRLRLYYESKAREPEPGADYVYYPLHHQPERSSVPMGLRYSDQLLALSTVAEALPPGWLVYVREHPRQFTDNHMRSLLARSRRFYDRLQLHERVRLISTRVSAEELVARSRCTATVAGSAGWEALAKGVPVVVFGVPWYLHCPGVEQVGSVADCAEAFRRVISGEFRVERDRVDAYRDWISSEGGFRGYPSDIFAKQSGLTPEENGRSYADEIARRLAAAVRTVAPAPGLQALASSPRL